MLNSTTVNRFNRLEGVMFLVWINQSCFHCLSSRAIYLVCQTAFYDEKQCRQKNNILFSSEMLIFLQHCKLTVKSGKGVHTPWGEIILVVKLQNAVVRRSSHSFSQSYLLKRETYENKNSSITRHRSEPVERPRCLQHGASDRIRSWMWRRGNSS